MSRSRSLIRLFCGVAVFTGALIASATDLEVEIGQSRTPATIDAKMEAAVKSFAKNVSRLTQKERDRLKRLGKYDDRLPFSLPTTVYLTQNGSRLSQPTYFRGTDAPITLAFDASGSRAFPSAYKQLLEDVFAHAQSTMNAVFGAPAVGGTVHVRNYDADIQDRYAVAGGYYVPDNGSGEQEIRFPVYSNPEATAVNFVHTLLLAYQGPNGYGFDAFREGITRAGTMRVVRTAGAMPVALDPGLIEQALQNTYDVGSFYDWYNQRALGGAKFIAPNLIDTQLPPGGSVGGLYLLRFQMAGSAWQKAIAEYTSFASTLNQILYAQPSLANDVPGLIAAGQTAIDSIAGGPNATIEGLSFAAWFKRQFILQTKDTLGLKLLLQPTPIPPIGGSSDFGVFDVAAHYFETRTGGDEILLSGTSYPIIWDHDYLRLFPSSQEDRMDVAGAYGSITPNFPNGHSGDKYRVTVDIPIADRIARAYLPAGGVATGSNTTENDFFGTIVGAPDNANLRVRLTYGVTTVDNIPVTRGAFGFLVDTPSFLNYARCRVEVIRTVNSVETTIVDRFVNKGPGPLALDLRVNNGELAFALPGGVPMGLSAIGIVGEPYANLPGALLGVPDNQVLAARWNPSKARYDIYPDAGAFVQGNGYFVRMPAAAAVTLEGKTSPGVPVAVALRPGWNMVATPLDSFVPNGSIQVVKAVDNPKTYAEALGVELGTTLFEFTPGPNDAATGAPETGTMTAVSTFTPGKMVFVRVLAPEGVTLVFRPTAPLRPLGAQTMVATGTPRFEMNVAVSQGSHRTNVVIGQSSSASSGFDRREDSNLPPGMGGIQSASMASEPLYRDIRPKNMGANFLVKTTGLRAGQYYRFETTYLSGQPVRYWWRMQGTSAWREAWGPVNMNFRASTSSVGFEIKVGANP